MSDLKKGNISEFLNRELPALGMRHVYLTWCDGKVTTNHHVIVKIVEVQHSLLFFAWTSVSCVVVASMTADTPTEKGVLQIALLECDDLLALQVLVSKLENEFGLRTEIEIVESF